MNGKCVSGNLCIGRLVIRCGNMKGNGWPKNQLPLEMGRWDEWCNIVEVQHNKDDYEHVGMQDLWFDTPSIECGLWNLNWQNCKP
jgi:hypothetical protein